MTDIVERLQAALICRPIPPELLREAADKIEGLRLDLAHANEQCDIFARTINDQAATITTLQREIDRLREQLRTVLLHVEELRLRATITAREINQVLPTPHNTDKRP